MFNDPIKEQYEKVFYSPDKVKRLIISNNNIGSYSYHVEKLTILEGEEIYWCGNYFFWNLYLAVVEYLFMKTLMIY